MHAFGVAALPTGAALSRLSLRSLAGYLAGGVWLSPRESPLTIVLTLGFAACSGCEASGGAPPPESDSSVGESAAVIDDGRDHDTGSEHDEDTGMVAFDDCAALVAGGLDAESLLSTDDDAIATYYAESGEASTLADQRSLDQYWAAHGLDAIAEKPQIDFEVSQVVALLAFEQPTCRTHEVPDGFFSSSTQVDGIVLSIETTEPCSSCDTGSRLYLELWKVKRGTLAVCRHGARCGSR